MWRVVRDPRPRTLVLGLTASVLVFFTFMTQMHERYAYAAVIFLVLLLPDGRPRWLWPAFGAAFTLICWPRRAADAGDRRTLPVGGPLGIAGAILACRRDRGGGLDAAPRCSGSSASDAGHGGRRP